MARYEVRSEPVRYRAAGELFSACLYRPRLSRPQPGLLLIQDGWEFDNHARGVAERLAHVGYVTLEWTRIPASSKQRWSCARRSRGCALGPL